MEPDFMPKIVPEIMPKSAPRTPPEILMYTSAVCPYCVAAKQLLKRKGVLGITEVAIDTMPGKREEMMQRTARRTVPQIYIGDRHVGGYDDLVALDRAGELDPLLARS